MSGAQDRRPPVYPDNQGKQETIELIYNQFYSKIRKYLYMKVDSEMADDLTQQVFLKAMEKLPSFRKESSLFTWLFKIAQNTLKNEYRAKSRSKESPYDLSDLGSQFIAFDFASHLEIRIDVSQALKKLSMRDQQILSLRFFVDCTLSEIAEIVEMRESAVKNRLYRSLSKLRNELKDWGGFNLMTVQSWISIVNKQEPDDQNKDRQIKVYEDLFNELQANVDRMAAKFNHKPSRKIVIEIYPDLPTFHQAVGEADAPDWFMGTIEGNKLKIVSPLNPGPEHTYRSILKSTIHLFAMWLMSDINPKVPKWIRQGIGGYEADQMTTAFINNSIYDSIQQGNVPSFEELNNDSWDFESMKGFQFSYRFIEFIAKEYGLPELNQLIRNPNGFREIFHCSESEFHDRWILYLKQQLFP
ncbi:RNA polymerase sigma factor [Paenibacillus sp. J2TS4]|uniref:RNA polymerase sigma factor n=1 Tax=Paenibacillus sp. J2TS4 TaxID=2807194 RepID=UPI001B13685F|nr:sigma-70 family RNA polymerase sigma factor [Paenibacillus sp. J2TS4]GIP31588.1 hypothetical protein J2TS4_07980 [Paenibacillus sp. J2TS4]